MPKNIAVLSIIVALALGATLGYYVGYDHGWETSANLQITPPPASNNDESPNENEGVVFHKDANGNFYGTLTLTGYLDVQKRVCEPDTPCGSTVDYASFVFTQTTSEAIKEFVGTTNAGNSSVAGDRVGIGCQQKDLNRIFYENFADEDKVTGEIKGNDYTKLIASSKNNQIELKLTRELYTSGQGAPDCYSHFRNLDVL